MRHKNYIERLVKDEVVLLVPQEHANDVRVNDLKAHLINYSFDVEVIPCCIETLVVMINQDTERRMELLGAVGYYKIPEVDCHIWIEQHDGTLFTNRLFQ